MKYRLKQTRKCVLGVDQHKKGYGHITFAKNANKNEITNMLNRIRLLNQDFGNVNTVMEKDTNCSPSLTLFGFALLSRKKLNFLLKNETLKMSPPASNISKEEEDNITFIAENVFNHPYLAPKSISLDFSDVDPESLQDVLFLICYKGIKILWGDGKNFVDLSREQFELLQNYIESIGFELTVTCNNAGQDPWEMDKKDIQNYQIQFKLMR